MTLQQYTAARERDSTLESISIHINFVVRSLLAPSNDVDVAKMLFACCTVWVWYLHRCWLSRVCVFRQLSSLYLVTHARCLRWMKFFFIFKDIHVLIKKGFLAEIFAHMWWAHDVRWWSESERVEFSLSCCHAGLWNNHMRRASARGVCPCIDNEDKDELSLASTQRLMENFTTNFVVFSLSCDFAITSRSALENFFFLLVEKRSSSLDVVAYVTRSWWISNVPRNWNFFFRLWWANLPPFHSMQNWWLRWNSNNNKMRKKWQKKKETERQPTIDTAESEAISWWWQNAWILLCSENIVYWAMMVFHLSFMWTRNIFHLLSLHSVYRTSSHQAEKEEEGDELVTRAKMGSEKDNGESNQQRRETFKNIFFAASIVHSRTKPPIRRHMNRSWSYIFHHLFFSSASSPPMPSLFHTVFPPFYFYFFFYPSISSSSSPPSLHTHHTLSELQLHFTFTQHASPL